MLTPALTLTLTLARARYQSPASLDERQSFDSRICGCHNEAISTGEGGFTPERLRLPRWARYLFDCGRTICTVPRAVTLVITVPRREFAAGLVALGSLALREQEEWDLLSHSVPSFKVGQMVVFSSLRDDRLRSGWVHSV